MKNIEIKVGLEDFKAVSGILKEIKAKHIGKLNQTDTYFVCPSGRLKLRKVNNKRFFLIFYKRPNKKGFKVSDYYIRKIGKKQAHDARSIFRDVLGEMVTVRKVRDLWIYKNTRIHLDSVSGLGKFLELETVLRDVDRRSELLEHKKLATILGILKCKRYGQSYSDMIIGCKGESKKLKT